MKEQKVLGKGSVLFQYALASMSEDKSKIDKICKKFNVVKMSFVREN